MTTKYKQLLQALDMTAHSQHVTQKDITCNGSGGAKWAAADQPELASWALLAYRGH